MRPIRKRPDDFRKSFVTGGWISVQHRYRAHSSIARRWVDEEGRDGLLAERAAYRVRARAARETQMSAAAPTPERIPT